MATLDSSCDNWQSREEECNSIRQEKSWFIASVAVSLIVAALVVAPGAWAASTFKILHVFRRFSGGHNAMGTLVSDAAGNLYGTTFNGGFVSNTAFCGTTSEGCGVVFKLAPNPDGTWTEHVLHTFKGGSTTDGGFPLAGVILDAAGNLYGTTFAGGSDASGTVFELMPNPDGTWTEHVLYSFMGGGDGAVPFAGVILDAAGNLYGTTYSGGSSTCMNDWGPGCGVVFKLTHKSDGTWTEHVLHRFTGGKDGGSPFAGVILDAAGNLYGTNTGVVFKLAPNPDGTWTEHVLHSFTGGDGANPGAGVIFDAAGNLYGTTTYGGLSNVGVVFKLTHKSDGTWTEHVLYSFTGGGDGAYPWAGVILDATGNLYGTTYYGGVGNFGQGNGVVFELTRSASGGWSERVLHAFLGYGANPYAGLLRGASGNLYGTASGGTSGGLVFEIKP
jgi:uncharacterized repeat protein (TIGR03803 family)